MAKVINQAFSGANKTIRALLVSHFPTLFAMNFFILLPSMMQFGSPMDHADPGLHIFKILTTVTFSMATTYLLMMFVCLRLEEGLRTDSPASLWEFVKKQTIPLTIESLRMYAFLIGWTLLLIIPGIYKGLRWFLMPYVVMFDKDYESGELDPLKKSDTLTRGIFPGIIFLSFINATVPYAVTVLLPMAQDTSLILVLPIIILNTILTTYLQSIFYYLFKHRIDELKQRNLNEATI